MKDVIVGYYTKKDFEVSLFAFTMNDSANSSSLPQDPESKPTSAFERWRRKAMLVTGLGVTKEERLADLRMHQTRQCEKTKEYLVNYSACYALTGIVKHTTHITSRRNA